MSNDESLDRRLGEARGPRLDPKAVARLMSPKGPTPAQPRRNLERGSPVHFASTGLPRMRHAVRARALRYADEMSIGARSCQSVSDWSRRPSRSSVISSKFLPMSCRLVGRPERVKPFGRHNVGDPVRLVG